jgi:hypothetical protein
MLIRLTRSLAGALLVCGSALADKPEKPEPVVVTNTTTNPVPTTVRGPVTVQGTATVNVSNTATNPVPTKAQGTTQVSGAVDVLSAPPVTGSVAVSNQPTVNLAPGNTVAVSGTVNVASQPPVSLAPGTSVGIAGTPTVAVSSLPAVQIGGTPNVKVTGTTAVQLSAAEDANLSAISTATSKMQFDPSGSLKVTGSSGTVNVGNFPATQNVGGTVGLSAGANTVKIDPANNGRTMIVLTDADVGGTVVPASGIVHRMDVSPYGRIRVKVANLCTSPTSVNVSLFDNNGVLFALDQYTVNACDFKDKIYDLPGVSLFLNIGATGGATTDRIVAQVFGR